MPKKGDAQRLVIHDAMDDRDKLTATGPDPDGDVQLDFDAENESPVAVTLNREGQVKLRDFLNHALGE